MKFKKGDKVYDRHHGWGVVCRRIWNSTGYCIEVEFKHGFESYTDDGRNYSELEPTLSFTEYTLEGFSQERPEPLPEKGQLVYVRHGSEWVMRFYSHKEGEHYCCFERQRKDGSTCPWKHLSIKNPLE